MLSLKTSHFALSIPMQIVPVGRHGYSLTDGVRPLFREKVCDGGEYAVLLTCCNYPLGRIQWATGSCDQYLSHLRYINVLSNAVFEVMARSPKLKATLPL